MFYEGSRFRGFAASASPRIMFLKRLLVCYALCGVYYSEDRDWVTGLTGLTGLGNGHSGAMV